MSAHQRIERLQRDAAYRLRSKFHAQSTHVGKAHGEFSYSPFAKAMKISELVQKHREQPMNSTAELVKKEIRSFRIPSLEEDTNLKASRIVLQAIGYFKLASEQTCADLIEMHCLHTYGLDSKAVGEFFTILQKLKFPRHTEVVTRLAPRVDMVAHDLTVSECSRVLEAISRCSQMSRPASTIKAVCATIKKFSANETDPIKICRTVSSVARCDRLQARLLLEVYLGSLQKAFLSEAENDHKVLREVTYALSAVAGGPRQLLNCVCRTAVNRALTLSAKDIADVVHCMHLCSHRGEAVIRRLASVQLTQPEAQTPETVALTLAAMAHFFIFDEEIYSGLLRSVAKTVDGEQAASIVLSCGRVRCYQPWVWELALPNFMAHLSQQSTRAICAALLFISDGILADRYAEETQLILAELCRRDDVSGREDVMRSVLALQQHVKAAPVLEYVAILARKA